MFYRVTKDAVELNTQNVIIAVVFLAFLLIAAFYAHSIGWESGASTILAAFTAGAGVFVGALLGERNAVVPPAR